MKEVQIHNASVRVTRRMLAPGEATGHHRHQHQYVVVPLTDGSLEIDHGGRMTAFVICSGVSYFREAGAEHSVSNVGETSVAFVEIELLGARPGED